MNNPVNALRTVLLYIIHALLLFSTLPWLLRPKRHERYFWGSTPIANNLYWSAALKSAGYPAQTLMREYYPIQRREDFDLYFEDTLPHWLRSPRLSLLRPYGALAYLIRHARVVHLSCEGFALAQTPFWWLEAQLLRTAGIRTVVIPYGSDAYMYSQIKDSSMHHALLATKTEAMAQRESCIARRVSYWVKHADVMLTGFMMDGIGRWDVTVGQTIAIDIESWRPRQPQTEHDGRSGTVKIIHTPNHRGFKGSEFLLQAVDELQAEGLQIELILLEKVPNWRVRELMQEADILAEQFIFPGGYALSGIEGMATGLPVLANLSGEFYTRVFRRYAFLDECPVLSTTPETLKRHLRLLVCNPSLRKELGQAGRFYVEKYHSYATARYLFESIYARICEQQAIDLQNLFHPLSSEYVRARPPVNHPLVESLLPAEHPAWQQLDSL